MPAPLVGLALGAAARIAAKKAATKAVTKTVTKNVKVKPARKPVGNPPNESRALEEMISSVSRGAIRQGGSQGKTKTTRVFNSSANKRKPDVRTPARTPEQGNRSAFKYDTIKINTDPTKPKGVFGPLKKKLETANTSANRAKAKTNARGLKAANKKTNKVGSKADKEIRSRTKSVVLSKEETATLNDYYYGLPNLTQVMSRRVPKNDARSVRKFTPTPKKKSAVQLRPKKK
jgi:hypothetical protein